MAIGPKISVCQHIPVAGHDLELNFQLASKLVRQAASEGCDLAVLPEYSLAIPHGEHSEWADRDSRYLKRFQQLAAELGINLVPGTIGEWEDLSGDGNFVLSNNAYFIDRSGNLLATYRKKNLWHPEREFFIKGEDEHTVFDTPEFGKVGLLICWDLGFPEAFRCLVKLGVETIIAPTCWTHADAGPGLRYNKNSEGQFLNALCTLRAFENEVVFVFANIGAEEQDRALGGVGMSQICAPFFGQIAGFTDQRRGVITAEVDYSCLKVAEEVYKVRQDVMKTDWHYGTKCDKCG
ncbi:putative Hydrolase, carbon-nitrogen family [Taphrina deformans PYCC 5710]|uniref:Hydrolase, carbon-nitrogen family n=1 Tax=Taphrina deformans (strain PYCC 5710 / ATCC 11124 / CBS 356.35 / IMI 108563 / JCM 9778 / NBRC 8474) TaxID=1097556 RepID=R4X891_TAPDE|nr:putative Hydrolase, carbon-nitrogen family [Taphrina deformans PYCC 5710]|eukprot:CCG81764.1 putative Hydrolase, carbon-nitrogen family [Taphrina deformans PYCC 5710]